MTKEELYKQVPVINMLRNIPYLRKKHKLSKKAFAEKLQVSVYTITQIEKGILPKRCNYNIIPRAYSEFGAYICNSMEELED